MSFLSEIKDTTTHRIEAGLLALACLLPAAYSTAKFVSPPGGEPAAVQTVDSAVKWLSNSAFPTYEGNLAFAVRTTPTEIQSDPSGWVGKSVALGGDLQLTRNNSLTYSHMSPNGPPRYSSSRPCYHLDVTHRYDLVSPAGSMEVVYDHDHEFGRSRGTFAVEYSTKHFGPEPGVQIVVGTVKQSDFQQ